MSNGQKKKVKSKGEDRVPYQQWEHTQLLQRSEYYITVYINIHFTKNTSLK